MATAEGLANTAFSLMTGLLAMLVAKGVFSREEMVDFLALGISKLSTATENEFVAETRQHLERLQETFRDPKKRPISH